MTSIADTLERNSRVGQVSTLASQLRGGIADISGWQLGYMWDTRRAGVAAAFSAQDGYNRIGYQKSEDRLTKQLAEFPDRELTPDEAGRLAAVRKEYAAFFAADDR